MSPVLLLCGCVATQQDMLQMQSQMDELNIAISSMQKNQAELAVKMEDLSRDLTASSENMKDISSQMTKLSEQLDNMDVAMNKRVNAIGQSLKKQQESVENTLLPSKIYNDAHTALLNNNFDLAVSGFKQYLIDFPTGELAEGAYFFLGESLYLKTEWEQAAWSYASLMDKFPKSARVPAARLKYAMSLLKMPEPKTDEATKYLKSLVKDFPTSAEAETAKIQLSKYNNAKKPAAKPAPKPAVKTKLPVKAQTKNTESKAQPTSTAAQVTSTATAGSANTNTESK